MTENETLLLETLKETTQTLSWICFNESRGISDKLLTPLRAVENAKSIIETIEKSNSNEFVDAILNFDPNSDRVSYEEMEQQLKDHDFLVEMIDNISKELKNLMGGYWDIAYREGVTGQHLSEEANKVIFSFENNLKALAHIAKSSN